MLVLCSAVLAFLRLAAANHCGIWTGDQDAPDGDKFVVTYPDSWASSNDNEVQFQFWTRYPSTEREGRAQVELRTYSNGQVRAGTSFDGAYKGMTVVEAIRGNQVPGVHELAKAETSNSPVNMNVRSTLYQGLNRAHSFNLIPTHTLAKKYRVLAPYFEGETIRQWIVVVAVDGRTTVKMEIPYDPPHNGADLVARIGGTSYPAATNNLFSFTIEGRMKKVEIQGLAGDLSGSFIEADGTIAVFVGTEASIKGVGYTFYDQLIPPSGWGREYLFLLPKQLVRVIAEKSTTVMVNAQRMRFRRGGSFDTFTFTPSGGDNTDKVLVTSDTAGIMVQRVDLEGNHDRTIPQPAFLTMSPSSKWANYYLVSADTDNTWIYVTTWMFNDFTLLIDESPAQIDFKWAINDLFEGKTFIYGSKQLPRRGRMVMRSATGNHFGLWVATRGSNIPKTTGLNPRTTTAAPANSNSGNAGERQGENYVPGDWVIEYEPTRRFKTQRKCIPCGEVDNQKCDGIDNDCDGYIDEEVKDGKDNDNDGNIDEDWGYEDKTKTTTVAPGDRSDKGGTNANEKSTQEKPRHGRYRPGRHGRWTPGGMSQGGGGFWEGIFAGGGGDSWGRPKPRVQCSGMGRVAFREGTHNHDGRGQDEDDDGGDVLGSLLIAGGVLASLLAVGGVAGFLFLGPGMNFMDF